MHKKHFIALADMIVDYNEENYKVPFTNNQIAALAHFCRQQNSQFNENRWLNYIAGVCGPNGGAIKKL